MQYTIFLLDYKVRAMHTLFIAFKAFSKNGVTTFASVEVWVRTIQSPRETHFLLFRRCPRNASLNGEDLLFNRKTSEKPSRSRAGLFLENGGMYQRQLPDPLRLRKGRGV